MPPNSDKLLLLSTIFSSPKFALTPLPKQFFWENDSSQKFRDALQSEDIQRMIHDFMSTTAITRNVDMNLDAVENILISTFQPQNAV